MSERFIKFIPSEAAMKFAVKYKNAFILLLIIAESARRTNGSSDGLKVGQCHLGSAKTYDMTDKEYRYAKKILVREGLIKIVLTNRTRKKAEQTKKLFETTSGATERATEPTTTGTLVELCNSDVWDINAEISNHSKGDRKGDQGATEGRLKGDKQEREECKERKEEEKLIARTAKRPRSVDALSFDHESWSFTGITEKDVADWKLMYPHIEIQVETLKAAQWFKNNQSKSRRASYRKYLTGWFGRENERIENKKAYRSAAGGSAQDRRTKDIEGNPVDSPHTGRF